MFKNASKAAAAIVALAVVCAVFARVRRSRHPEPPRPSPQSAPPVSIAVKPVAPLAPSIAPSHPITVSAAVSTVCGLNPATADRYEARNDALRAITRERNLATNDVAALMSWLVSTDDPLHVERLAALKNDVMNLLRNQDPPPPDLVLALTAMFDGGLHPPAVLDYCIQHL